jgi:hypothetical protein
MNDIELRQLIEDLCNQAGKDSGVTFQPGSSGSHNGGEWEVDRFSNTQGELTIVLRRWKASNSPRSAEFSIPYPETEELKSELVKRASETISLLLES